MNGLTMINGYVAPRSSVPSDCTLVDGEIIRNEELDELTYVCDRCGDRHLKEGDVEQVEVKIGYADYEYWCSDCADDEAGYCDDCGERVSYDYGEFLNDMGTFVCNECLEDNYILCDHCDEYHRRDEMYEVRNVGRVCEYCAENYYYYCEECDEYVDSDDWDGELEMCSACAEEHERETATENTTVVDDNGVDSNISPRSDNAVRRGYHNRPSWWNSFVGSRNALSNTAYKGIGIELEVDRTASGSSQFMQRALNRIDRITNSEVVYFNNDCSLRDGFEIISRPHTLDAFEQVPWGEILDACKENGFSSHDAETCGLHVHFSRLMFGDDADTQDENISKLVQFFELFWDDLVRASRREGNQLRWCGKKGFISKKRIKDYVKGKYGGHSEAINNANDDTVEIRIMRGTLNEKSFRACIDLLVTLVNNACRVEWGDITDLDEMLKGIKVETAEYLMNRNAFYDEARRIRYNG